MYKCNLQKARLIFCFVVNSFQASSTDHQENRSLLNADDSAKGKTYTLMLKVKYDKNNIWSSSLIKRR